MIKNGEYETISKKVGLFARNSSGDNEKSTTIIMQKRQ
jgi:hypothetical protein